MIHRGDKMFSKKEKNKNQQIDNSKVNDVLILSKKILHIVYVLVIILAIYIGLRVFKELNLKATCLIILKTISPLFIGIFIAWLFDPFVKFLSKKGIRRTLGTTFTYLLLIGFMILMVCSIIPLLYDQINDFVKVLPTVFDFVKDWVDGLFHSLSNIEYINAAAIKNQLFNNIEQWGSNLTNSLPTMVIGILKSIFSVAGSLVVGMIIGFYLLLNFDSANDLIITLLPKKMRNDGRDLMNEVNTSLRKFIQGLLLDALLIFVIMAIGFSIVGLKAPLLFALFCGITNIIPYAGPYIGGAPAVIVGFSQSPLIGIITLIIIVIVQFLEGNFLQPLIMSKTTKLHPVTIMLGLLLFGYFFGILGMVISTPIIAACKSIFMYFNDKYKIIGNEE